MVAIGKQVLEQGREVKRWCIKVARKSLPTVMSGNCEPDACEGPQCKLCEHHRATLVVVPCRKCHMPNKVASPVEGAMWNQDVPLSNGWKIGDITWAGSGRYGEVHTFRDGRRVPQTGSWGGGEDSFCTL